MKHYPALFSRGTIFESYPFLLPNLVCAAFVVFSLVIGILFLDETHSQKKNRRDYGRELGSWLVVQVQCRFGQRQGYSKLGETTFVENDSLIRCTTPPNYASAGSSPVLCATRGKSRTDIEPAETSFSREFPVVEAPEAIRKVFSAQVILHIVAFGILAL